jgi:hypothetical protein
MKLSKTLLIMIQLTLFVLIITNTPNNQSFLERGSTIRTARSYGGTDGIDDIVVVDCDFIKAFVKFITNGMKEQKKYYTINKSTKKLIKKEKNRLNGAKTIQIAKNLDENGKKYNLSLFEFKLKINLYKFVKQVVVKLRPLLHYPTYYDDIEDINGASLIIALIYINRLTTKIYITKKNIQR